MEKLQTKRNHWKTLNLCKASRVSIRYHDNSLIYNCSRIHELIFNCLQCGARQTIVEHYNSL